MIAQVPSTWETQMEFLTPGLPLAVVDILGVDYYVEKIISFSNFQINKSFKKNLIFYKIPPIRYNFFS